MPDLTVQTKMSSTGPKKRILYILVMGLTGAGKSTFISVVTGNEDIPIGAPSDLDGVTQEVQDYILYYHHKGCRYEIHLIDSPGFDDGTLNDAQVLSEIATYINTSYKLKQRLAGVLYLHDITKAKVGGVGKINLRMLENLIGMEKCNNCTLVTTKWGCTNLQDEEKREKTLSVEKKFFGAMLQNAQQAKMKRFEPKTRKSALDIIIPYLENEFTPHISRQMVDPRGPKLPLGETEAGKVVADNLEKLSQTKQEQKMVQHAQEILSQSYDESLFEEFKQKRKVLRRKIHMQQSGRWIMRTAIVGGAIVATVLTLGPGASAFALEPVYEKAVRGQRKAEKKAKVDLKADFIEKSKNANQLRQTNPDWLWDNKVKRLQDLEKSYSLKSGSSDSDISKVVRLGEKVGFARSEDSEAPLHAADWECSDSSDSSESDAEQE
ncbi:hypothetical protein HO133_006861 [Letharia lupina]|uniref:G domain-containing protein n=1 Tax=Letharia lupina TaxID=560253 RepID=A0A8H6C621_9LECA|nr:uncharacterized protein HO133_006861 [Letharia lupina]KAF6217523.1 hypothetical protein HO133_006861 [Letharia lupina]